MGLFSLAMTDPRCMELIGEPKQVCLDRAKGFDGDKPSWLGYWPVLSPSGRFWLWQWPNLI
jgi:hypothetical protein